jgi:hypothetical protein
MQTRKLSLDEKLKIWTSTGNCVGVSKPDAVA